MNDKQVKALSLANRQEIAAKLDKLSRNMGIDRQAIAKIEELKRALAAQAPTADSAVLAIDDDISAVIADAQKDIASGHAIMMSARLDKVNGLIVKRAQLCPESSLPGTKRDEKQREKMEKLRLKEKQKREKEIERRRKRGEDVGSIYTPEELLENMLQMAIDEKMAHTKTLQNLHDRLVKDPNDAYARAMWKPTQIKIEEKEKFIRAYGNEIQRTVLVSSMGTFNAGYKEMIANRKVDDSQFQMMMQDFAKAGVDFNADQQLVNENTDIFMSDGASATAVGGFDSLSTPTAGIATPAAGMATPTAAAAPAFTTGSPIYGTAADPIFSDPAFIGMGGGPAAPKSNLQEAFENVDKYLSGLNNVLKKLDTEIDRAEEKRQDVAADLKELLRRRRAANADECMALDAQIDRLGNEHAMIERTIATLKQRSAMCVERRAIASGVKDLKTVGDIDNYLNDITGGQFDDLSNLALDMKKAYEDANQALEDLGVTREVASPDINSSTMIGASYAAKLENAEKDEDKYAEMEKKFGLR